MDTILVVCIRSLAAYVFFLILSRLMGRKMISQMTFFDFVVGVTAGTLTSSIALGSVKSPLASAAALTVFALLTVLTGLGDIKSSLFTKFVDSEPVILIENGRMVYENLRRVRLPVVELLMLLREKNIFNVNDVDYAVFEINGKLSVLPKPERKPVTPADMGFTPTYRGMDRELIVDGRIKEENLTAAGWTESSLLTRLQEQGVIEIGDVLLASVDSANNIHISLKQTGEESHGKHGID